MFRNQHLTLIRMEVEIFHLSKVRLLITRQIFLPIQQRAIILAILDGVVRPVLKRSVIAKNVLFQDIRQSLLKKEADVSDIQKHPGSSKQEIKM